MSDAPSGLWASGFRPFYLLGCLLLPLALAAGAAGQGGALAAAWHGHAMVFGFALAIVAGTVLTALPSWAGTPEVRGGLLAGLAALWLAGRLAMALAPALPPALAAVLDSAFVPALVVVLAPQLARAAERRHALLLPLLVVLALAQGAWHGAIAAHDAAGAERALRAAVWAIVVLFALVGGVLTPVFTGNALAARGRGAQAAFMPGLERAALAALVALAGADLAAAPAPVQAVLALAALALQGWRVARWRGWRAGGEPLVAAMNLGFAWLLAALAIKAAQALGAPLPAAAWLHVFTLGALGSMMLGLMTRVALRHTGRPLVAPRGLAAGLAVIALATLLRLAAGVHGLGPWAYAGAAVAWCACFIAWLATYARILVAPSLPRG